jgi:hypothetical protein
MPQPTGGSGRPVGSSSFPVGGAGPLTPTNSMDYNNPVNFQRTSARCMFQASNAQTLPSLGSVPGFDFGDIVKVTGDLSPTEVEVYTSQNGYQTLARMDVAKLKPVWTISCHEILKDNFAAMFSGTDNGPVVQAAATATVFPIINPQPGSCWDVGSSDLTTVLVKAGATSPGTTTLVAGVDYDLLPKMGWIRFLDTSTLVTGLTNVYVTYSAPTVTFEGYTAFSQPNVLGFLTMVVTDSFSAAYRWKVICQTILSSKKLLDSDVSKFAEIDLTAAIIGTPTITFNTGLTNV